MKNSDKLKEALKLLKSVSADWDETLVESYPPELPSFDELVDSMMAIELNDKHPTPDLYEYSLKLGAKIDEVQPLESLGYLCEQEMHTGAVCIWKKGPRANEDTIWCSPFWEGQRNVSIQLESEFGSPKSEDIALEPTFNLHDDICAWKAIMVKWLQENNK